MATFKKLKNVTLPLFKLANNTENYFKFMAAFRVGKVVDDKKEPPTIAHVVNLETGEEGEIIVGAVLKQEIENAYPNGEYVGRCFEIVKHAPEGARKYSLWNIAEVAEPEKEVADTAAPVKGDKKK